MITISVYDDPLTVLYLGSSLSTTRPGGSTTLSRAYFFPDSTPDVTTLSVDLGYLLQVKSKPYGAMRDKPVMQQRFDGEVDAFCHTLVEHGDDGGHAFKSGSAIMPYELIGKWFHPAQATKILDRETRIISSENRTYVDTADPILITRMRPVDGNVVAFQSLYYYPSQDVYATDSGVLLQTDPASVVSYIYAVGLDREYHGQGYAGCATLYIYGSDPSDAQITDWLVGKGFYYPPGSYGSLDVASLGTPQDIARSIADHLSREDFECLRPYYAYHPVDFGDLALECASQLKYVEDNVLLIVQDLLTLRQDSKSLRTLFASSEWLRIKNALLAAKGSKGAIRHIRRIASPFSQVFLGWKYVFAPNISDLSKIGRGIASAISDASVRRLHSRKITSVPLPNGRILRHTAVFTTEVNTFGERDWSMLQELIYLGKRWGMYPEVINLWDICAWSFVVDWFVQYGDFFDKIDAYLNQANYFPVKYCIMSEKFGFTLGAADLVPLAGVTGEVSISYYHRWISEVVPLPSIQEPQADISLSKHWVEAFALVAKR